MNEEPKVRIVIRRPRHGPAHHGGAWKVAYADFVTTMMALFIVLWIIGQSEAVKQAVAMYFKNPGVFRDQPAPAVAPGGAGLLPGERTVAAVVERETEGDGGHEERALQEAAARIRELIESGGAFENLRDQVRIAVTAEGLRIDLVEKDNAPFFKVGSAVPIHPLTPLLRTLKQIVGTLPNHITVEGHTDSRRYADPSRYSNWELSVDRANVARRLLEGDGLREGQVDRVVGHADRLLARADDPLHATNRRISLLVRREMQAQRPG